MYMVCSLSTLPFQTLLDSEIDNNVSVLTPTPLSKEILNDLRENFNLNYTLSQDDNDESNDLISLKTLTSCDYYDATEFNNFFNAPDLNDRSFKIFPY